MGRPKKDVYHDYITGKDVKLGKGDKVLYLNQDKATYIGKNENGTGRIQLDDSGQILFNRENMNVHKWTKL